MLNSVHFSRHYLFNLLHLHIIKKNSILLRSDSTTRDGHSSGSSGGI
jgi:hypothetical protein